MTILSVIVYYLLLELIISIILIYICYSSAGIDHMPIFYEWKYIKNEKSSVIKYAEILLMILTLPIDFYFFIFKWIFIFYKKIKEKLKSKFKKK